GPHLAEQGLEGARTRRAGRAAAQAVDPASVHDDPLGRRAPLRGRRPLRGRDVVHVLPADGDVVVRVARPERAGLARVVLDPVLDVLGRDCVERLSQDRDVRALGLALLTAARAGTASARRAAAGAPARAAPAGGAAAPSRPGPAPRRSAGRSGVARMSCGTGGAPRSGDAPRTDGPAAGRRSARSDAAAGTDRSPRADGTAAGRAAGTGGSARGDGAARADGPPVPRGGRAGARTGSSRE